MEKTKMIIVCIMTILLCNTSIGQTIQQKIDKEFQGSQSEKAALFIVERMAQEIELTEWQRNRLLQIEKEYAEKRMAANLEEDKETKDEMRKVALYEYNSVLEDILATEQLEQLNEKQNLRQEQNRSRNQTQ